MKHRRFYLICLSVFFSFLLGPGCESEMKDPKGTLEKQAKQYWTERLINRNFEYTYEEEATENLPPFSTYKKQLINVTKFPTSSVEVKEVKVEGDLGTVKYMVTCIVPGFPKALPVPLGDYWIMEGNKWRHKREIKAPAKK
jgi:hypothetical protein